MLKRSIIFLLSCLFLVVGCNPGVFIGEDDRMTVSVDSLQVADTGDTLNISLNQDEWYIQQVLYLLGDYAYHEGDVTQDGVTLSSIPMQMEGFGEISARCDYNRFKIIRDKYDELTVILSPNFTYKECELRLYLTKGIQTKTVIIIQRPSEGFVIDRVEWDEKLSSVGSMSIESADIKRKYTRRLYIEGLMHTGDGSRMWRSYLMKLLDVDSIRLQIPDPYPVDLTLTFSGEYIDLHPDKDIYEIDMSPVTKEGGGDASIGPYASARFITYGTDYSIYVRHVRDSNIVLCFTGTFFNESPELK